MVAHGAVITGDHLYSDLLEHRRIAGTMVKIHCQFVPNVFVTIGLTRTATESGVKFSQVGIWMSCYIKTYLLNCINSLSPQLAVMQMVS